MLDPASLEAIERLTPMPRLLVKALIAEEGRAVAFASLKARLYGQRAIGSNPDDCRVYLRNRVDRARRDLRAMGRADLADRIAAVTSVGYRWSDGSKPRNEAIERRARAAYEALLHHRGARLVPFADLPEAEQDEWRAIARAGRSFENGYPPPALLPGVSR